MKSLKAKDLRTLAFLTIIIVTTGLFSIGWAQDSEGPDSCTSIMVGRLATTDGSVITCHTCDGNYRNWLNIVPHRTHPKGATNKIYWGTLHTETVDDMRGKLLKGEIPEVDETFAFMNVAYPCLNEKQLAIGETTIGGRRELENDDGLFLIEELERIALERCSTARDALRLIGELVKKYGYGDSGECITIADKKEVWQLEIMGGGPGEPGSVWAAARIPDDHVGVSANIPRISEINLKDPDNYMASDNVFSLAEKMGWWKKDEPFKFWKAYSGRRPFSDREFYILSTLAPSLNLKRDAEELPFSVKPAKQMSVRDVMKYYRETYEGTDMDATRNLMVPRRAGRGAAAGTDGSEMVKSPVASAWMGGDLINLLNTLKPGTVQAPRTIAIAGCAYSQIIQVRGWLPDEIGAIAWFSFDNPAQSPRIPIFSGVLSLPKSFEVDSQKKYREDSASWAFRKANRLATIKWGTTRRIMEGAVADFETRAFDELPAIEKIAQDMLKSDPSEQGRKKCQDFVTRYSNDFARAAIDKWNELADTFWGMFARGF
ncbi:MAG: C69 family dipeptidase [Acidobacteriia bacterium]|nr:C69 family dipeptidase [Terriglobia bacterium]